MPPKAQKKKITETEVLEALVQSPTEPINEETKPTRKTRNKITETQVLAEVDQSPTEPINKETRPTRKPRTKTTTLTLPKVIRSDSPKAKSDGEEMPGEPKGKLIKTTKKAPKKAAKLEVDDEAKAAKKTPRKDSDESAPPKKMTKKSIKEAEAIAESETKQESVTTKKPTKTALKEDEPEMPRLSYEVEENDTEEVLPKKMTKKSIKDAENIVSSGTASATAESETKQESVTTKKPTKTALKEDEPEMPRLSYEVEENDTEEVLPKKMTKKSNKMVETKDMASSTTELEAVHSNEQLPIKKMTKKALKDAEDHLESSEPAVEVATETKARGRNRKKLSPEKVLDVPEVVVEPKSRGRKKKVETDSEDKKTQNQATTLEPSSLSPVQVKVKNLSQEEIEAVQDTLSDKKETRTRSTRAKPVVAAEPEKNEEPVKEATEVKRRGRKPAARKEELPDEENKENEKVVKTKTTGKAGTKDAKVSIEHCTSWPVFGRQATALINELALQLPDIEYVKNETKPRRQSFEITLELNDQSFLIWSGIKLKPRREKFPEADTVLQQLQKHLNE